MADHAYQLPRQNVVRPLSAAGMRRCSRPGCPSPAQATLSFSYETREARLDTLHDEERRENYDLCRAHADRTRPPHNWTLTDRRPDDPDPTTPPTSDELGSERTVAVLAAALRSVPDPVVPAATVPPAPLEAPPAVDVDRPMVTDAERDAALRELAGVAREAAVAAVDVPEAALDLDDPLLDATPAAPAGDGIRRSMASPDAAPRSVPASRRD